MSRKLIMKGVRSLPRRDALPTFAAFTRAYSSIMSFLNLQVIRHCVGDVLEKVMATALISRIWRFKHFFLPSTMCGSAGFSNSLRSGCLQKASVPFPARPATYLQSWRCYGFLLAPVITFHVKKGFQFDVCVLHLRWIIMFYIYTHNFYYLYLSCVIIADCIRLGISIRRFLFSKRILRNFCRIETGAPIEYLPIMFVRRILTWVFPIGKAL